MSIQDRAKKAVGKRDSVMDGKQKVSINDIIARYPEGVTLRHMQIIEDHKRNTVYGVCVCDEEPTAFFFGGVGIVGLIESLLKEYNNDEVTFAEDLAKEGLKVKFSQKRSQFGNTYTAVEVL